MALIRNLRCKLNSDELSAKKDELVVAMSELDSLKEKLSDVKAEYGDQIRETNGRIERTVREIREEAEERPVSCREVKDDRKGQISIVREDTGDIIETRRMTADDRQEALPGTEDDEDFDDDEDE